MCLRLVTTNLDTVICTQLSNAVCHGFKIIDHHQLLTIKPLKQLGLGKFPMAVGKCNMFDIGGTGYGQTDAFWSTDKIRCQCNFVPQLDN